MAKRGWNELSSATRKLIVVLGIVQVGLIAVAHGDITRRPAEEIRGPKRMWRLISLISFAGPIAYFCVGRRRQEALTPES